MVKSYLHKDPKEKLEFLHRSYASLLLAYAQKNWNINEDDLWDIIYQSLFKVSEVWLKYNLESEKQLKSFLFKVFINGLKNHFNRSKNQEHENIDSLKDALNEKEEASESQELITLKDILDGLEEWERILLHLRSQGLPYAEISQYVDKEEKQLKVYYQRLKAKVKLKMESITKKQLEYE